jgi:hypothetical protein
MAFIHDAISPRRFGNWQLHKARKRIGGKITGSPRAKRHSYFKGIVWCPWRGRHGMWAAHLPPELNEGFTGGRRGQAQLRARKHEEVVGYFVKETDAVEARRKAISKRHVAMARSRGEPPHPHHRLHLDKTDHSHDSYHWERGHHRIKKNHMHHQNPARRHPHASVEEMLTVPDRTFRKYDRDNAWHPLQHTKARDRSAAQVDTHAGGTIPRHDDHGHLPHGHPDQRHAKPIECTSLPPLPPPSPRAGGHVGKNNNHMFRRENLLDLEQMARFDRRDRDRRANNGRQSYNNFAQHQHAWMVSQAMTADRRRAAVRATARAQQIRNVTM